MATNQQKAERSEGERKEVAIEKRKPERGLFRWWRGRRREPPATFTGTPFSTIRMMMDDMERWFERPFFGRALPWDAWGEEPSPETIFGRELWAPDIDIFERDEEFVVYADLPGMKKEDVRLEIREGYLYIEGERRYEREERPRGGYRLERGYGSFSRTIPLPEGTNPDTAKAEMKDGVLEVRFALPDESKQGRRQIEIGSGETGQKRVH